MTAVFDMCAAHQTSDNRRSLMAKKMAVFDMYMSICVHVRSWSTAPLISGFKVSNQIVFGMGSLGSIPSYLASEI